MAKKILITLLVVVLTLGITACNLFGADETPTQTEYKANFFIDGNFAANQKISNQIIVFPQAPEKVGYVFIGWYLEPANPTTKVEDDYFVSSPATADVNLYAHYAKAEYKLMFSVNGELKADLEAPFSGNSPISLPAAPELEGKIFDGWYLSPGFEGTAVNTNTFVHMPTFADVTLYAKYSDAPVVPDFNVMPYSANGCTIISLNKTDIVDVVIPEEVVIDIGGVPTTYIVERIEAGAFMGNTQIKSVVIPDTVTSIGDYAFYGCTALENIIVPKTVSNETDAIGNYLNIGSDILGGTTALKIIEAPVWIIPYVNAASLTEVVLNAGEEIPANTFKNSVKLKSIELNDGLKKISAEAFSGCSLLSKIHIPASVDSIANNAFVNCSAVNEITVSSANTTYESNNSHCIVHTETKTLIFGCKNTGLYNGVKVIDQYAFSGCVGLESVKIPGTVTNIVDGAFAGCVSLKTVMTDSANKKYEGVNNCLIEVNTQADGSVKRTLVLGTNNSVITEEMKIDSISKSAFAAAAALKEIYIPTSVFEIAKDTFAGCVALEKVTIANPELKLDSDIFANCKSIKSVTVPSDMLAETIIKNKVFANCAAIKNIDAPAEIAEYLVRISGNTVETIVVSGGEELSRESFKDCKALTSVTLPTTLKVIGDSAFENCEKLSKVSFNGECGLAVIGHHAFSGCKLFSAFGDGKELVVPKSVGEIGEYAFSGTAITAVELEDGSKLASVGHMVFGNCQKLVSVDLPATIESVDYNAFGSSNNIKNASIPAHAIRCLGAAKVEVLNVISGERIDTYALRGNATLKELNLPKELEYIDVRGFEGCSALAKITVDAENAIYESVDNCIITKADKTLILGCKSSIIPDGVKTIASYAFAKSTVAKIVIPKSVEVIEAFAFAECKKLSEIVIKGEPVIDSYAFDGTNAITKAVIPASAISAICKDTLNTLEITSGETIADGALKNCTSLTTLTVCDTIKSVGKDVFKGCVNITTVTAPALILEHLEGDNVVTVIVNAPADIEADVLAGFTVLKSITLPAGVYEVEDGAFDACINLESANVPAFVVSKLPGESIKTLVINSGDKVSGEGIVFPELVSVEFAASVVEIDAQLFAASAKLATIKVGEGASKYHVVENCLIADDGTLVLGCGVKVTLPAEVTAIGKYAFAGKKELASVVLPEGLVRIEDGAFLGCEALVIDSYTETLEYIGANAFAGCASLTKVVLPDTVKAIGAGAFSDCIAVEEIRLADGVELGEGVFTGCTAVVKVEAPVYAFDSLPVDSIVDLTVFAGKLEDFALLHFVSLKNLTIGKGVEVVTGKSVLVNLVNSLETVKVDPDNATYAGKDNCVYTKDGGVLVLGCKNSVIPGDVKVIATDAFANCVGITELVITEGVATIEKNAFIDCTGLVSVALPATLTNIDPLAFSGCTALESITVSDANTVYASVNNSLINVGNKTLVIGCKTSVIPADVEVIGAYAFAGVTGLVEIKIPASIHTIGEHAFDGCEGLVNVVFVNANSDESKLAELGDGVFANCVLLEKVVVPVSVAKISESAFDGSDAAICFGGTSLEWNDLAITASNPVYFYNEAYIYDGVATYWHYDIDGNVEIWV